MKSINKWNLLSDIKGMWLVAHYTILDTPEQNEITKR